MVSLLAPCLGWAQNFIPRSLCAVTFLPLVHVCLWDIWRLHHSLPSLIYTDFYLLFLNLWPSSLALNSHFIPDFIGFPFPSNSSSNHVKELERGHVLVFHWVFLGNIQQNKYRILSLPYCQNGHKYPSNLSLSLYLLDFCILYLHTFLPSLSYVVSFPLWFILSIDIRDVFLTHISVHRNVLTPMYGMQAHPPMWVFSYFFSLIIFHCFSMSTLYSRYAKLFAVSSMGYAVAQICLFPCQFFSSDTLL